MRTETDWATKRHQENFFVLGFVDHAPMVSHMKIARSIPSNRPDRRDGMRRALAEKGPSFDPAFSHLIELIPDLEQTPEWHEATACPYHETWRKSSADAHSIRGAIATTVIRKLRDVNVRKSIEKGDPFWLELAINVVSSKEKWHQSGRIQASVLRSLSRRLLVAELADDERRRLNLVIGSALLHKVDTGAGEEFRTLASIARRIATEQIIAALDERARISELRSVRTNAQRMLDYIKGKPYKRYVDSQS